MSRVRYGSKNIFNLTSDFKPQNTSENEANTFSSTKDSFGNEKCTSLNSQINTVQALYTYEGVDLIADVKNSFILGGLKEGLVITSINVELTNTAPPRISITGHEHLDGNGHDGSASLLNEYEVDLGLVFLTAPDCMGVPIDGPFSNSNPNASTRSLSVNFKCSHNDITSNLGDHKCGYNHDGKMSVSATFIGNPEVELPEGWNITSIPLSTSNTSFEITEISAYKPLTRIAV